MMLFHHTMCVHADSQPQFHFFASSEAVISNTDFGCVQYVCFIHTVSTLIQSLQSLGNTSASRLTSWMVELAPVTHLPLRRQQSSKHTRGNERKGDQ